MNIGNDFIYSLDKEALNYEKNYPDIEVKIKETIKGNVDRALNSGYVSNKVGIFSESNFINKFTLTGSIKINSLDFLGESKNYFAAKGGRYFFNKTKATEEFILRGPRYIAAIDPQLSVLQKLIIYREDIFDGIALISDVRHNRLKQYLEIAPVLDYVKNALVTLYPRRTV